MGGKTEEIVSEKSDEISDLFTVNSFPIFSFSNELLGLFSTSFISLHRKEKRNKLSENKQDKLNTY